jgi:pilus assembly protein CpaC
VQIPIQLVPVPGVPAQAAPGMPSVVQAPGAAAGPQRLYPMTVQVTVDQGAGRLLQLPAPAATVMAADPRIARVQPASPTSLFLMAAAPGRTTVIATAEDGSPIMEYEVTVRPSRFAATEGVPRDAGRAAGGPSGPPGVNAREFERLLRRNLRGAESVRVTAVRDTLILSGVVPTAGDVQRIAAIAHAYAGEGREVINNLSALNSITVNVRVRVAEISREITRELGFNWQALGNSANWLLGVRIGSPAAIATIPVAPLLTPGGLTGNRIGVGYRGGNIDVNGIIDALAADQLISILAEPNLTAQSGEVASFLAGGEFPVPVASGNNGTAITVEFKQFGVSLAFVPTVMSAERLNLRIRPEVSELSDRGAIELPIQGGTIRIPALSVRRAETTIELGSGQSFAIAGLLSRTSAQLSSGPFGLADVPVIGALFRSERFRRNETELVIIVTPYLVRPVSDPNALAAPTDGFRPATDLDRILLQRQIARGMPASTPRAPTDAGFIVE